jgi:hypothetical protein
MREDRTSERDPESAGQVNGSASSTAAEAMPDAASDIETRAWSLVLMRGTVKAQFRATSRTAMGEKMTGQGVGGGFDEFRGGGLSRSLGLEKSRVGGQEPGPGRGVPAGTELSEERSNEKALVALEGMHAGALRLRRRE